MSAKQNLTFFAILLLVGVFFGYPAILKKGPESTHAWRQSDCAALAKNYYRSDLKFFQPRLFNRQEGEGFMVGEFTGTYFMAAVFYKVFGVHDGILRGIHLIIFLFGMLALMKVAFRFMEDRFLAIVVSLLFFSAPVLTYYGNNFIPDVPAFGFLMMGWAAFLRFRNDKTYKHWWQAVAFFSLAGLMKITFLMSVGALGLFLLLESVFKIDIEEKKLFPDLRKAWVGFLVILLVVGSWYVFSIQYNKLHDSSYFLNATYPIWADVNRDYFHFTLTRTFFFWSKYYFFPGLGVLFVLMVPWVLTRGKKARGNFHFGICLLTFLGALAIWLLWFYQFTDHDYYIIALYPFFIFTLIGAFKMLKENYSRFIESIPVKILLGLFLVASLVFARHTMGERYTGKFAYKPNPVLSETGFQEYLTTLGINKDTKVISIPDISPNISLHRLNLPGFTEWKDTKRNRISVERMQHFIDLGAQFMIIHDPESLEKDYVKAYSSDLAGEYNDVRIFDLSSYFR